MLHLDHMTLQSLVLGSETGSIRLAVENTFIAPVEPGILP